MITSSVILKNERGAALVTALLVLVILTIMGTIAMTIRNTEQSIVRNSEVFQHNFYSLEGVTLEGAHALDNLEDSCLLDFSDPICNNRPANISPNLWSKVQGLSWLRPANDTDTALDMTQQINWPSGSITPVATSLDVASVPALNLNWQLPAGLIPPGYNEAAGDRIWFSALDQGVCAVTSVTDPTKTEKCYDVYGMYDVKRGGGKAYTGRMMLLVGYQQVVYTTP